MQLPSIRSLQKKMDRCSHWLQNFNETNHFYLPIVPTYVLFKTYYLNGSVTLERQVGPLTRNQFAYQ